MIVLVPEDQLVTRDPYERNTQAMKKVQVQILERKIEEDKKREEEEIRKRLDEAAQKGAGEGTALSIVPRNDKELTSKLVPAATQEQNRQAANTALTRVMGENTAMLDRVLEAAGSGLVVPWASGPSVIGASMLNWQWDSTRSVGPWVPVVAGLLEQAPGVVVVILGRLTFVVSLV